MARGKTKGLEQQIYDVIPNVGMYERDVINRFLHRFTLAMITDTLADLCKRNIIRRCGDSLRPLYVRKESPKIYYSNIRPIDNHEALKTLISNPTVTEKRDEQQNTSPGS